MPLLIILIINGLPLHIEFCDIDLFADYSTMSTSSSSISLLVNVIQADLLNLNEWCKKNDMTFNLTKTKAMFISTEHIIPRIISENQI